MDITTCLFSIALSFQVCLIAGVIMHKIKPQTLLWYSLTRHTAFTIIYACQGNPSFPCELLLAFAVLTTLIFFRKKRII